MNKRFTAQSDLIAQYAKQSSRLRGYRQEIGRHVENSCRKSEQARRNFISWEVVARCRTGAATPAPGHDAIMLWPRDKRL
jgi:hypothetical protein